MSAGRPIKYEFEQGVVMAFDRLRPKGPWDEMEVGDSIRFGKHREAYNKARTLCRLHAPKKFKSGYCRELIARVWRVE